MNEREAAFEEWLKEEVQAALSDRRAPVPIDNVFKRLRAKVTRASRVLKGSTRGRQFAVEPGKRQ